MLHNKFQYLFAFTLSFAFNSVFADTNKIEKQNWKKYTTAKTIKVDNPTGDIRLRFGGYEDEFEIIAMIQHIEQVGYLEIEEKIEDNTYYLSVKRMDKATGKEINLQQDDKARVDFTVYVPLGRTVFASTDHGLLEARKMKDPVNLTTNSGNIFLRDNKNAVQAKTNSGQITANLLEIASTQKQVFTTETGMIDIWVAENAKQNVVMATSGDIISEFSTELSRDLSKEPNKTATILTNGGGAEIEAMSKRGHVALRVYPQ
jgi:DUF4097 and DUF4098 domain-containing protein YvlB